MSNKMESMVDKTPEPDYGFAATLPLTEKVAGQSFANKDALAKAIISSQGVLQADEDFDDSASEFTDIPETEISCEFAKELVAYHDGY
jgi:hypothetical protein